MSCFTKVVHKSFVCSLKDCGRSFQKTNRATGTQRDVMEPVTLLESVYNAVTSGDIELWKTSFGQMTVETVLEFERRYEESPLHLCVKKGGMKSLSMVQCLLRSGLFDDASMDKDGRTILTLAYETGNRELLNALIEVTTERMDDATAVYRILRHDSLEIFEAFLGINKFTEEEEFECIASALIQLNAKHVKLSDDLHIFTLWKISDYGFRNLSGDWSGTKDPNEWKHHFEIVRKCSEDIMEHHDTGMYDDVDDLLLHRLHTLHNHLYFLKHKEFLKYLPIQEAIFCVAIFVSIHRDDENFREYRLTVNKCLVVEIARMINSQLTKVKAILDQAEKDLLSIMNEAYDDQIQDGLIEELLVKLESSQLRNREYVVKKYKEQAKSIGSSNKDALIRELMNKAKSIDKQWLAEKMKTIKDLDKKREDSLKDEICKRIPYMSHPQKVANRLMSGLKKGLPGADIVADIVSNDAFDLSHLMEEERCSTQKLIDCFTITKQYYSLKKIVHYCEPVLGSSNLLADNTLSEMACIKRTMQVLGEAIKNTTNTPNSPGKALSAVNSMLTEAFSNTNKKLREVLSHSVPLKKVLVGDARLYQINLHSIYGPFIHARMAFCLVFIFAFFDMKVMFYHFMTQCNSLDCIRSLALYVGDMTDLDKWLDVYYKITVKGIYNRISASKPRKQQQENQQFYNCFDNNRSILRDLGKHLKENANMRYGDLRRACRFGDDLASIRRLLSWKRKVSCVKKFYLKLNTSWQADYGRREEYSQRFYTMNLLNHRVNMKCAEEFDYIDHTRELINNLGVFQISEDALEQLNKNLKPYYNDMFCLSTKWNVLKKFFEKNNLTWDEKASKTLVDIDRQKLQQMYDQLQGQLRSILKKVGLRVDRPTKSLLKLPAHMLSAIECIQLEMCEMLQSAGYFGDSFHYVKHGIPMLQGRNYRNFLAHDSLSYNLLTNSSSMDKIAINAFVFATREVHLFGPKANKKVDLSFPSLTEIEKDVTRQKQLLEAFQTGRIKKMHDIVREGGEIKMARFCSTQNSALGAAKYFYPAELVHPCQIDKLMVEYLSNYFKNFLDSSNDTVCQMKMLEKLSGFEWLKLQEQLKILKHFTKRTKCLHAMSDEMLHRTFGSIFRTVVQHCNAEGVSKLVPFLEWFTHTKGRDPLSDAMLCCERSIAELLLDCITVPNVKAIQLSIILHWDDIFQRLMEKKNIAESEYQLLRKTAFETGNYTAVEYLLFPYQRLKPPFKLWKVLFYCMVSVFRSNYPKIDEATFEQCALAAVHAGDEPLLTLLFRATGRVDATRLAVILREATEQERWKCVEILLENRAAADEPFFDIFVAELNTFLLLVKHGKHKLLGHIDRSSMNQNNLGDVATLLLAVAVKNGMATDQVINTLQQLGFDWLDSSQVLHAAIQTRNYDIVERILNRVEEEYVSHENTYPKHFQLALAVLNRWKMISFLEESNSPGFSLICALQNNDTKMVEKLLEQGRKTRTMPEVGLLGGIVFRWNSCYICALKRNEGQPELTIKECCKEMIEAMKMRSMKSKDFVWRHIVVKTLSIPITFHVFAAEKDTLEPFSHDNDDYDDACDDVDASLTLANHDSLQDCLEKLHIFVSSKLNRFDMIYATYSTATGMKQFWQIGDIACMYDVQPLEGPVDLSDSVNYKGSEGATSLCYCFSIEMARLLVENGANPLHEIWEGLTPIHISMMRLDIDYKVTQYLFDECIERNLRSEHGCSVLELGKGLIHTAVLYGRRDIIKRLLEHGADVSATNSEGQTPAQYAASYPFYRTDRIVKMLLEYDAKSVNHIDNDGLTLVQYAASHESPELLKAVLDYEPDLCLYREGPSALGIAVQHCRIDSAKCILEYAETQNITGLTRLDKMDLVVESLKCNNKELSTKLLEYELQRPVAEANDQDLARFERIKGRKKASIDKLKKHKLHESADFMRELSAQITEIKIRKNDAK